MKVALCLASPLDEDSVEAIPKMRFHKGEGQQHLNLIEFVLAKGVAQVVSVQDNEIHGEMCILAAQN
jgi:hypothetical protein